MIRLTTLGAAAAVGAAVRVGVAVGVAFAASPPRVVAERERGDHTHGRRQHEAGGDERLGPLSTA